MDNRFAEELLRQRRSRSVTLPVKADAWRFAEHLLGLLFPHFSDEAYYTSGEVQGEASLLMRDLRGVLAPLGPKMRASVDDTVHAFGAELPRLYGLLWRDAEAIERGDPAAESVDEVISAYPGFLAIAVYRIANVFYRLGVPVFPRILTEGAHQRTGIDIHPGATIGEDFFIDHGTGIVVGETTLIGRNVKLYQGVTLGALSVDKSLGASKRHPTIEDNVVIYSNATILGGNTVIGHDSVIGGNVWLTESVPPLSVVYHRSDVKVRPVQPGEEPLNFVI